MVDGVRETDMIVSPPLEKAKEAASELNIPLDRYQTTPQSSIFPRKGGSHFLVSNGQELYHIWDPSTEGLSWSSIGPDGLRRLAISQIECLRERLSVEGRDGHMLAYQPFGSLGSDEQDTTLAEAQTISRLDEGSSVLIRIDTGTERTVIEYMTRPEPDMSAPFMLSRLNTNGCRSVPELLGVSYWSKGGERRPWLRATRTKVDTGPAMRPFLTDINELCTSLMGLEGDRAKRFLVSLTSSERFPSLSAAFRLGYSLGELHGKLVLGPEEASALRTDGPRGRMADMFTLGRMDMEDIGSIMGSFSSSLSAVRKGLTRLLGDPEPIAPTGQRKLKVLRRKGRSGRGEDLEALSVLRGHILGTARVSRSLAMGLKGFVGSPTIIAGIDARLDRVDATRDGIFLFKRFDWRLYPGTERRDGRTIALKDLSLVLNSFMKARYLSAMNLLRKASISSRVPMDELQTIFLDYNMAKKGHRTMMTDIPVWLRIGAKDVAFRYVFASSIVGSIWFEKARNQLVRGYNMGVAMSGREELLDYPEKADTVEGMRIMQCIAALSSASDALTFPEGPRSTVGLANDLTTVLLV